MNLLRALRAAARYYWWQFVLFVAPLDKPIVGRDWPNTLDARWFSYQAGTELKEFLHGKD